MINLALSATVTSWPPIGQRSDGPLAIGGGTQVVVDEGRNSYDEKYRVIMSTSKAIFQNNRIAQ